MNKAKLALFVAKNRAWIAPAGVLALAAVGYLVYTQL